MTIVATNVCPLVGAISVQVTVVAATPDVSHVVFLTLATDDPVFCGS